MKRSEDSLQEVILSITMGPSHRDRNRQDGQAQQQVFTHQPPHQPRCPSFSDVKIDGLQHPQQPLFTVFWDCCLVPWSSFSETHFFLA